MLVALALFAVPVPEALAQAPARPEPQELWRQFPLDDARNRQAPAERPPASRVAPPSRSGPEEGDGSLSTIQIAAIVLMMGLLLMGLVLMVTTGVLAYATRGDGQLGIDRLRRLRTRTRRSGAAVNTLGTAGRRLGALASRLRERTVRVTTESGGNALSTVHEALDAYLASRADKSIADEELDRLKTKRKAHTASASSPADEELEILKAKLGARGGGAGGARPDEVETLKAKLAGKTMPKEGKTTTRNVLDAEPMNAAGAPPKNRPREAARVASNERRKQVAHRSRRRKGWQ